MTQSRIDYFGGWQYRQEFADPEFINDHNNDSVTLLDDSFMVGICSVNTDYFTEIPIDVIIDLLQRQGYKVTK